MATHNGDPEDTWTLTHEEMHEYNCLKDFKKCEIEKRRQQYPELAHKIRAVCKKHGYALGIHGSEVRDLDLIACPWTDDCSSLEALVEAVIADTGAYRLHPSRGYNVPENKPQGRIAYLLAYGGPLVVDFSVMPKLQKLSIFEHILHEFVQGNHARAAWFVRFRQFLVELRTRFVGKWLT